MGNPSISPNIGHPNIFRIGMIGQFNTHMTGSMDHRNATSSLGIVKDIVLWAQPVTGYQPMEDQGTKRDLVDGMRRTDVKAWRLVK